MSLYRILGIAKSASKLEIKAAYRKLALQFHPDKHTQSSKQARDAAADKFKQMSAAYETLVDDRKRTAYDIILNRANSSHQSDKRQHRQSYTYEHGFGAAGAGAGNPKSYRHDINTNSNTKSDKKEYTWIEILYRLGFAIICLVIDGAIDTRKLNRELDKIRERHDRELEECRERHERELEVHQESNKLRKRHQRELEEHRKRHERELEEHRERHQRERERERQRAAERHR